MPIYMFWGTMEQSIELDMSINNLINSSRSNDYQLQDNVFNSKLTLDRS